MVDRWKPENGILGGMLQDNERGRYVTFSDHEAALKAKDAEIELLKQQVADYAEQLETRDAYGDLVETLKAKDTEIARLQLIYDDLRHEFRGAVSGYDALEKDYDALMRQAVKFAVRARDWGNDAVVAEAQAFLNSPDVQERHDQ